MPFFIGYPTLEGWKQIVDIDYQVYAMLLVESRGAFALQKYTVATLAQPVDDEVHYCRVQLSVTDWIGGECTNKDRYWREAQALIGWELILAWLDEQGLKRVEAAVAVPADLREGLLAGNAGFLGYDDKTGYFRKEKTA